MKFLTLWTTTAPPQRSELRRSVDRVHFVFTIPTKGVVAHMVERYVSNVEARGSIPLYSILCSFSHSPLWPADGITWYIGNSISSSIIGWIGRQESCSLSNWGGMYYIVMLNSFNFY
jgi:hypothetical protein